MRRMGTSLMQARQHKGPSLNSCDNAYVAPLPDSCIKHHTVCHIFGVSQLWSKSVACVGSHVQLMQHRHAVPAMSLLSAFAL